MTDPRQHSRRVYAAIKAATRSLLESCGTLAQAAGETRVQPTKLSHYGSIHHDDSFMPADVIADLEASAGEPVVTRELARIAGYALFRLPERAGERETWVAMLGEIAKDTSAVINRLAEALGNDGKVTAKEVRKLDIIAITDEALTQLVALRHAAASAVDEAEERHK